MKMLFRIMSASCLESPVGTPLPKVGGAINIPLVSGHLTAVQDNKFFSHTSSCSHSFQGEAAFKPEHLSAPTEGSMRAFGNEEQPGAEVFGFGKEKSPLSWRHPD